MESPFEDYGTLEVRQTCGWRGYFAGRDILAGEVVFRADPYAWVVYPQLEKNCCVGCGSSDTR